MSFCCAILWSIRCWRGMKSVTMCAAVALPAAAADAPVAAARFRAPARVLATARVFGFTVVALAAPMGVSATPIIPAFGRRHDPSGSSCFGKIHFDCWQCAVQVMKCVLQTQRHAIPVDPLRSNVHRTCWRCAWWGYVLTHILPIAGASSVLSLISCGASALGGGGAAGRSALRDLHVSQHQVVRHRLEACVQGGDFTSGTAPDRFPPKSG